jgi:hypothetical protein
MIIKRKEILRHLSRILCGGFFGEVVLYDRFACAAVTTDRTFMVLTDGLPDVEPLPEPVGVLDLDLLIRSIKVFGEDGNDDIAIDFEDERIRIAEDKRGDIVLITATPATIQTVVQPESVKNVTKIVKKDKGYALPQSTAESILRAVSTLKGDVVRVSRLKAKTVFGVGPAESNSANNIPLPRAKLRKEESDEPYELHLIAGCVASALQQLDDFTSAEILFTGPESVVSIWDEGVAYYLSPTEPSK